MSTRYVNAKKGKSSGAFDSPLKPARSIEDALRVAKAGDTIEIQDAATYKVRELVIDRALTLVSSQALSSAGADPINPLFDRKLLPELTLASGARSRVLRISGTPGTRATAGPVLIKGLRITGGHSVHSATEPGLGAGGGVCIIDIDNVTLERCVITGNQTETLPFAPWPEPDRLAFRAAALDLLGAIVTPTAEGFINKLIDAANAALTLTGHAPLAHLSRATLIADMGTAIDAKLPAGRLNQWLAGQAFGGGVATVWASATLRRCLIQSNKAEGRGSGVAVVGYGWPTLDTCWIDGNKYGSKGRRDGGGVACEVAFPGKMSRNLSELELLRFLTAKLGATKAMIGSPLAHISVSDVINFVKWVANPLLPIPPVRGLRALLLDIIARRKKAAAEKLLYFGATSALGLSRWDAWNEAEIEQARKSAVKLSDCSLSSNTCADDGGGLYASVLSRVSMTRTRVLQNTAEDTGGGVRLTMGSAGELSNCELLGNTAIAKKDNKIGGGGLAARNVDLTLTQTRIGPASGGIGAHSNVCPDRAGGGIAFAADTEGALAGIPDLWTGILLEVFKVSSVKVRIDATCAITNNGAGYDPQRAALSTTTQAKGGGIWLLQGEFPDAPRVDLSVDAVAATIRGNVAQTKRYKSKVDSGMIAAANEVCIQNMVGRKEWTETNFTPIVSGGKLKFAP